MGIKGLLPFLEKATKPCYLSEYRGATVAIDTYCWLHKGATACCLQLAQGEETELYVNYCLKYVKMLQSFDITPILVFDGQNLPAKSLTEARRRQSRINAKKRAAELLRLGKTEEARSYMKQSINVTPEMASAVIKACHQLNVDCIVAPYESDAQLAFFNLKGIADIVITEDSDLILFGCSKVMYKLDLQGRGFLVEAEKIPQAMQFRPDKYTCDKFRFMCILSGCDYVDSLPGIGLKKALKFIRLTDETNPLIFLKNVPRYLNMCSIKVTDEYIENFMIANATFLHQIVFDPFKRKLVHLQDPSVCGTSFEYCKNAGEIYDNNRAYEVALGNVHPTSDKKLDSWYPSETKTTSIWSNLYKKIVSRKKEQAQLKSLRVIKKQEPQNIPTNNEQDKILEERFINKELEFYFKKPVKAEPEDGINKVRSSVAVDKELSPSYDLSIEVKNEQKYFIEHEITSAKNDNSEKAEANSEYSEGMIENGSYKEHIRSEDDDNPQDDSKISDSLDLHTIIERLKKERTKSAPTPVVTSRFFSKSVVEMTDENNILDNTNPITSIHTETSRTQYTNTEETDDTREVTENIEESSSVTKSADTGECSTAKRRKVVIRRTLGMRRENPSQQKISDFFAGFRKK